MVNKSILLIDDSWFMRTITKNCLMGGGFQQFLEAENGWEGIKKYQAHKPDVVILDITLPDINGVEVLRQIRTFDPKACVVILSALGQEPLIRQTILLGAKSFVVKPFQKDYLLDVVKQVCADD